MSDILRQVDEDLRKDRLLRIWKLYGIYIVGFILLILIALAIHQYYLSSTKLRNEEIVEKYINAINTTDKNISINQLIDLDESSNEYIKGLAKLKRAELYYSTDKKDEAVNLLESISKDDSLDEVIRHLSLYKYLMIKLDVLDQDLLIEIIDSNDLKESKFKYYFKELKALKLLIVGEREKSLLTFEAIINDEKSPIDLKIRSEKFKEILK